MSYQEQLSQSQADFGVTPVRDPREETHSVWDTLSAAGQFSRFLDAARAAQVEVNLRGPELITAFAIPDDALANETDEVLRAAVGQHIVRGYQTIADLRTTATVTTVEGAPVTVGYDDGEARFGDARITHGDIACTNGIIQVLDRLMKQCAYSG